MTDSQLSIVLRNWLYTVHLYTVYILFTTYDFWITPNWFYIWALREIGTRKFIKPQYRTINRMRIFRHANNYCSIRTIILMRIFRHSNKYCSIRTNTWMRDIRHNESSNCGRSQRGHVHDCSFVALRKQNCSGQELGYQRIYTRSASRYFANLSIPRLRPGSFHHAKSMNYKWRLSLAQSLITHLIRSSDNETTIWKPDALKRTLPGWNASWIIVFKVIRLIYHELTHWNLIPHRHCVRYLYFCPTRSQFIVEFSGV